MVWKREANKMKNLIKLKNKINNTIERLFLIVFPPFGEDSLSEVDIRLGLVFKENSNLLLIIGTDMNDLWSPKLKVEPVPVVHFDEFDFENRVIQWMEKKIDDDLSLEYYDLTRSILFKDIIGEKVIEIEAIIIEGDLQPFGLKFHFKDDFIISHPISDGNTVRTKKFNNNEKLTNFNSLGTVRYIRISSC